MLPGDTQSCLAKSKAANFQNTFGLQVTQRMVVLRPYSRLSRANNYPWTKMDLTFTSASSASTSNVRLECWSIDGNSLEAYALPPAQGCSRCSGLYEVAQSHHRSSK